LKIVVVNLNYRISVHMNFAQSRITALVCSLQSEYDCHQARGQWGGATGQCHPQFQIFRLIKYLKYKPKKYFSTNQQKCFKEPIPLQLLVEYKLVSDLL